MTWLVINLQNKLLWEITRQSSGLHTYRSHILKQTCRSKLQACLSMCTFKWTPGTKDLINFICKRASSAHTSTSYYVRMMLRIWHLIHQNVSLRILVMSSKFHDKIPSWKYRKFPSDVSMRCVSLPISSFSLRTKNLLTHLFSMLSRI